MPKRSSPAPAGQQSGFTLVEVMVASAILGLIVVLLVQVASMVSTTWSMGNRRSERVQSGRVMVDFISRELRAAALPVDSLSKGVVPDLQFVVNPPGLPAKFCQPQAVFWQAPLATSTVQGNMAVFGYFVRWDDSVTPPRASLCRLFQNPGAASHRVYQQLSWVTETVVDEAAPASASTGYRGLFSENVIGLWVRCFDATGAVISQTGTASGTFDSRRDYSENVRQSDGTVVNVTRLAPVLPTSMEVSLVVLDSQAASVLTSSLAEKIRSQASSSSTAAAFVTAMQNDAVMRKVVQGMSAQSLRVHLENAP
ncbi:MAG TPA: prepilin-type N-terminal cleavage/methylation domain-containing protein [Verrucomicrobium sp.]|nr:prepilin-type N-terminal cleavage/methylation domain-containing protein [Verrucomicrobium sp.]